MSLYAGQSLVKRTLLAIDYRVEGFLEMWPRVYVVIVLRIGDNNQGLLWFADAIGY
jgi:hypothetical protein